MSKVTFEEAVVMARYKSLAKRKGIILKNNSDFLSTKAQFAAKGYKDFKYIDPYTKKDLTGNYLFAGRMTGLSPKELDARYNAMKRHNPYITKEQFLNDIDIHFKEKFEELVDYYTDKYQGMSKAWIISHYIFGSE